MKIELLNLEHALINLDFFLKAGYKPGYNYKVENIKEDFEYFYKSVGPLGYRHNKLTIQIQHNSDNKGGYIYINSYK